ncbi:MAG: DNA-processing protein DprA [Deltaproteobacteria bacterium]|jgi:DNA processing protein|nr:DNA-processing protein DprA [Deltaproteobacteria bacterium]MBW2510823.1 DNA-processing protein DprA [Deltaproteobacteria bacterium]
MQQLLPWLRLQFIPGLGRVGLMRLIEHIKAPENAIDNADRGWSLAGLRNGLRRAIPAATDGKIRKACELLNKMKGRLLTIWDTDYPQRLRQIDDPPALLYCCGELPTEPAVAIVGSGKTFQANSDVDLSEPAGRVLAALDLTPRHSDELTLESGLTAMELSVILLHLELQGHAEKLPGGRYVRDRRVL